MRHLVLAILAFELTSALASAQQCVTPTYQPQCAAPTPSLSAAPVNPSTGRAFVRAPATGQTAGESNSIGIRGFAIHIPEMRIALPTLELPSLTRYRRDAEMLLDHSRAPLTEGIVQELGTLAPASPSPAPAAPNLLPANSGPNCVPAVPPAPSEASGCVNVEARRSINERLARLESLEREMAALKASFANQHKDERFGKAHLSVSTPASHQRSTLTHAPQSSVIQVKNRPNPESTTQPTAHQTNQSSGGDALEAPPSIGDYGDREMAAAKFAKMRRFFR